LLVRFRLPASAFASMFIRELTKLDDNTEALSMPTTSNRTDTRALSKKEAKVLYPKLYNRKVTVGRSLHEARVHGLVMRSGSKYGSLLPSNQSPKSVT
jgi:hypothetical protein